MSGKVSGYDFERGPSNEYPNMVPFGLVILQKKIKM
jgi:hypothetical protein